MRENNDQNKIFIIVAVILIVINLFGIFYGFHANAQYKQAKKLILKAYEKEYSNGLEEFAQNCQKSAEILCRAIICFVAKFVVGFMTGIIVFFPQQVYKCLKIDIEKHMSPDFKYKKLIEFIIIIFAIWNLVAPIISLGDYFDLYNELQEVISKLNVEKLINCIATF